MAFVKKIIILNEVAKGYGKSELRGLATVEKSGDKAVCRLTVFNLGDIKPGRFVFGIKSRNLRLQKYELNQPSQNFPLDKETDIEGVVSCILACGEPGGAVPLLWGSTDGKRIFEGNMTDGFNKYEAPKETEKPKGTDAGKERETAKEREKPEEQEAAKGPETPEEQEAQDYRQAAEGGTYIKEDAKGKINEEENSAEIKERADTDGKHEENKEEIRTASLKSGGKGGKEEDKETAASQYEDYAVAAENFYPADYGENAAEAPPPDINVLNSSLRGGKFYTAIKSQLDELFENYPKEEYLCSLLKGTDWVRVDYDNNGQYYTVGVITEDDAVKYICYGVPGKYAKTPPPELKGFCQWLPFDMEKPEAEGYWMMYQDAETGKSVTLEMI